MRRKLFYVFLVALAILLLAGWAVRSNPALRTRTYFSIHRSWHAHWPTERGSIPPRRVREFFQPFVPVRVEVEPHITMELDPDDVVSRAILENGRWEYDSWTRIEEHLKAGGTFVDVGAHIGYYSLKAAQVVGPTGHVVAVEPNPATLRVLRDNVQASGATEVAIQPVACSDAEAMLDLFAAARNNTGESSLSRANAMDAGSISNTYRVRARPLDDIVQETGLTRVDALKIDVEGAELLVLKGAKQTLTRYSPFVVIELIDRQLKEMGTSSAEVIEFMRALGYTARPQPNGNNTEFERLK